MNSIKRFLIIFLLAMIALSSFIAALQGYTSSLQKTEAMLDQQLHSVAKLFATLHSESDVDKEVESSDIIFQIFNADQQLLSKSSVLPNQPLVRLQKGFSYAPFDGYRWRTYIYNDMNSGRWVVVAERADMRYSLAENIIVAAIYPIVFSIPLIGLFIGLVISRGLMPLNQLANQLNKKKTQDLSPLNSESLPEELQEITASINALFARLANSFDREKRFSSDAAHELKTPLSALKVHLYNLKPLLPESDESLLLLNTSVDQMTHIIDQMLDFYRTNPEQMMPKLKLLDVHSLAQEVIADLYPKLAVKNQEIQLQGCHSAILGNDFAIKTLLKNLLDNAHKYTPQHGEIEVSITVENALVNIKVEDSGPGIPEQMYERVFERFHRLGGDQNNSSIAGCGLGLSIVRHIVELHQGEVILSRSSHLGGLAVTVLLPCYQELQYET